MSDAASAREFEPERRDANGRHARAGRADEPRRRGGTREVSPGPLAGGRDGGAPEKEMDGDGREDEEANVRGGVGEVEEGLDEGRDRAHPRPERPEMEPAGVSRGGEEDAVGVSAGAEAEAGETARAKGEGGFAGTRRGEEGEDEERQEEAGAARRWGRAGVYL